MRRRKPHETTINLAEALPKVAQSYLTFVSDEAHEADPKAFAARHMAAKTALSHLEQLLKLTAGREGAAAGDPAAIALDEARQEIDEEQREMATDDTGEPG